jgi:tetratricopeptide (TPR) repeat protein
MEARVLCNSALDIFEDTVGEYDTDYTSCLNTLGVSYIQDKDLENAMEILDRAAGLRNEMLGTVHPTYGVVCNNKAAVDFMQGEPPTAGPMFARCLKIGETMIGAACRDVQSAMTNLSGVLASQGLDSDAQSLVKGADMVKSLVEETEEKFKAQWQSGFVSELKKWYAHTPRGDPIQK